MTDHNKKSTAAEKKNISKAYYRLDIFKASSKQAKYENTDIGFFF